MVILLYVAMIRTTGESKPFLTIKTDSSLSGWGAVNENSGECIQGVWDECETREDINYLELKAGLLAIKTFCEPLQKCHIRVFLDNTVSVAYINRMGGKITNLNSLTKTIWQFCAEREIWLSACHLPGVENVEADFLSRNRNSDMEWKLHTQVFKSIIDIYGKCDIDLFASGLNYQFKPYASHEPDKNAAVIDALSIQWSNIKAYVFCPFSLLGRVLQKITVDQTEAIVIAPIWSTQTWFPQMLQMICQPSFILPNLPNLLYLPNNLDARHPLKKMRLGVFRVSGNRSKTEDYRRKLERFSCHAGGIPLKTVLDISKEMGVIL